MCQLTLLSVFCTQYLNKYDCIKLPDYCLVQNIYQCYLPILPAAFQKAASQWLHLIFYLLLACLVIYIRYLSCLQYYFNVMFAVFTNYGYLFLCMVCFALWGSFPISFIQTCFSSNETENKMTQ